MWYLLIPVACFLLLLGIGWVISLVPHSEKSWKGRITALDVMLSVLMTAKGYEPQLVLKVPRRATWLKMTFPNSAVWCELPLITRLQKSRKERYLALLHDLHLEAQVSKSDDDQDVLAFQVDGPPDQPAAVIKEAFQRLFEVDPTRTLEFRTTVNPLDWNVIEQALQGLRPGDKVDLPIASTNRFESDSSSDTATGCFWALAGLFLLPIPFVVAYLEFGVVVASAVLIAIVVGRDIYGRWKRGLGRFKFSDALKILVIGLAGATAVLGDPLYLQLLPTIVLSVAAIVEILPISFGISSAFQTQQHEPLPKIGRMLLSAAVIATCIGAAALNEYLRANAPLDTWIWYFAFFRIELVLGFMTALIPFVTYAARHLWKENQRQELAGDSENRGGGQ